MERAPAKVPPRVSRKNCGPSEHSSLKDLYGPVLLLPPAATDAVSAMGIMAKSPTRGRPRWNWVRREGLRQARSFVIREEGGLLILDWKPLVEWLVAEGLHLGPGKASSAFHFGLAEALSDIALELSRRTGVRETVLSGGVWQNKRLLSLTLPLLERKGLRPLTHHVLSPNDECVSVGQAAWHPSGA